MTPTCIGYGRAGAIAVIMLALPLAAMTLVKDGQGQATIVISEAALAAEVPTLGRNVAMSEAAKQRLAALELQRALAKMSGATLPLTSPAARPPGTIILVGPSALTADLNAQIPSGLTPVRHEDGFIILAEGDRLLLAGNDAGPYFGTFYAVADLLHRLGVRWIMPGEFGEIIPPQPTVEVAELAVTERPTFRFRTYWCNQSAEMGTLEALWKLRNKMQIDDMNVIGIPGDSWLRQYLPDKELIETRPEVFAKHLDGTTNPYMPNLSSPEAAKLVAEKVIAKVRAARDKGERLDSLGFAPDDGLPMDFTPQTINEVSQGFTDWLGREGVQKEQSISEEWFTFFNRVVEEVTKVYPDLIMSTNGYANRGQPPAGVKLHPNVAVMYAPIWADTLKPFFHPKSWHGTLQAVQLQRWCELSSLVFLYNYGATMLVTELTPVPQVRKLFTNYAWYAKQGVIGFFNETTQPFMQDGILTRYTRTRLMWDAKLPFEAHLADYYRNWYGPAAEPARACWDAVENCLLDGPSLGHEDRILPYLYTPELLTTMDRQLAVAEGLATAEPYRTHVRVDRLLQQHLQAYMDMRAAEFDAEYQTCVTHLERMLALRGELHEISPFLVMPAATTGIERYYNGEHYYGALQRRDHFQGLADKLSGKTGELVVMAPKMARFALDEVGLGRDLRWHDPAYDRSGWRDLDTTIPFYLQGYQSADGIPYVGRMWYVFDLDVPASAAGKSVHFYTPIVTAEAWVWVNGEYAGHRAYLEAYYRPAPIDLDVTAMLRPGQRNTIGVWVSTGANRTQASDGFMGRAFLYAPIAAK